MGVLADVFEMRRRLVVLRVVVEVVVGAIGEEDEGCRYEETVMVLLLS